MAKNTLTVFDVHRLKIARKTMRMPSALLGVMGGPSKAEARRTIIELTGKDPGRNGDR